MEQEFTAERVEMVAQAIAAHLQGDSRGIMVGYDTRRNSRRYAEAVAGVLAANGHQVLLPNRDVPTPVTAFTIINRGLAGAVMITASHNPPEYNGIKFIPEDGAPALPSVTDSIEHYLNLIQAEGRVRKMSLEEARHRQLVETFDPFPAYSHHIKSLMDTGRLEGLRVVCDPLYGTGRGYLDVVLREMGADVTCIHDRPDPEFGGGQPNPEAEYLAELIDAVVSRRAAAGLANDGDADRIGVIKDTGKYLSPNQLFVALLHYLLDRGARGDVVRTVATTHMVDSVAEYHGVRVHEVPVGFKWVAQAMREYDALMGGEESGGFTFRGHIPEKDGIYTALKTAEMLSRVGSLSEYWREVANLYGERFYRRVGVKVPVDVMRPAINALIKDPPDSVAGLDVKQVVTMDGLKLLLEEGSWLLLRPSGTEPLMRVYAESLRRETTEAIIDEGANLVYGD